MMKIESFWIWLEELMLPCYFKVVFGIDCPGCGGQRAVLLLLKGDVSASIVAYPPLLPIVFMVLLYFVNKRLHYTNKEKIFYVLAWGLAFLVFGNWVWKLIA